MLQQTTMDNLDESKKDAKVSDSAYSNSNSCSNSQSRRSLSSKSTHSGSNSSGSSGYGGKPSTSGSSNTLSQVPEKRTKDNERKKRKQQAHTELGQIQTDVEFRLPDPVPITEAEEELQIDSPPPASDQTQNGVQGRLEVVKEDTVEKPDNCVIPQPSTNTFTTKSGNTEGFSCVISMQDGVVMYTSTSLTDTLGFPKGMWIGRSFIDFVHPLDHNTFASQITSGLALPKEVNGSDAVKSPGNSVSTIFCRIRRYRSLATGFNVKERTVSFIPFMLKLSFKNVYEDKGSTIYLVIQAKPVFSAFKTPNEVFENPIPFVMRHLANGNLEYIDNEAVPRLGYLPQDITCKDMLKLYHPEDLPYLRHLYETIMKQGRVPRSEPYRMRAQNGDYIKLETEWSSFINPWSRKLEFVMGKHYVVEGPAIPDVFQPPPASKVTKVPEEDNIEIEGIKDSIVRILNEVPTRPAELVKQQMAKQCQDLASFIESLIEEQPKVEEELRIEIQEIDNSYYERDSVMLGGISPHHDYSDSKSSTGTRISYNQLNYNINLKRYFDSHQEAFDEDANVTNTTTVPIKGHVYTGKCMLPMIQYSTGDSMDITSESACMNYEEESPAAMPHAYQSIRLTESILTKHNSDMEKIFVKNHREARPAKKEERVKLSKESKQKKRDHLVRCNASFVPTTALITPVTVAQPHGLKRASKQGEVESSTHKQHCASSRQMHRRQPVSAAAPQPSVSTAPIWPCNFMNGMTPFVPQQQMSLMNPITAMPGFVPMYYSPAIACTPGMSGHDFTKNTAQGQFQAPPVQFMMYGPAVFGSPIVVSPINHQATFPRPPGVIQNQFTCVQNNLKLTTRNYEEACKPGLSLKPPSKSQMAAWREEMRVAAAGTKAACTRPGAGCSCSSSLFSATDALNRSNEEVPESSVSRYSNMKSEETIDRTDRESSYSSFYSSFFKTDSGSAEDSGDAKNKPNSLTFTIPGKDNLRNKHLQKRKKEPPWMEQVCVTSELVYKYQVLTKSLDEVLISDRKKLVGVEQPSLVNEQLSQLYMDLQLEGVAARLTLEEGITSSGSSSDDGHKFAIDALAKRARRKRKHSKLVIIYEEDAPLPPPEEDPELEPSTSVA